MNNRGKSKIDLLGTALWVFIILNVTGVFSKDDKDVDEVKPGFGKRITVIDYDKSIIQLYIQYSKYVDEHICKLKGVK